MPIPLAKFLCKQQPTLYHFTFSLNLKIHHNARAKELHDYTVVIPISVPGNGKTTKVPTESQAPPSTTIPRYKVSNDHHFLGLHHLEHKPPTKPPVGHHLCPARLALAIVNILPNKPNHPAHPSHNQTKSHPHIFLVETFNRPELPISPDSPSTLELPIISAK